MYNFFKELWEFLSSAAPAFYTAIGSGMFLGVDQAAEHFWPWLYKKLNKLSPTIRRGLMTIVLFGATAYGGFEAWRNEHAKSTHIQEQLSRKHATCRDEVVKKLENMHTEASDFIERLHILKNTSADQYILIDNQITLWGEGMKEYVRQALGDIELSRMLEGAEDLPTDFSHNWNQNALNTQKSVAFVRKKLGELIDKLKKDCHCIDRSTASAS